MESLEKTFQFFHDEVYTNFWGKSGNLGFFLDEIFFVAISSIAKFNIINSAAS